MELWQNSSKTQFNVGKYLFRCTIQRVQPTVCPYELWPCIRAVGTRAEEVLTSQWTESRERDRRDQEQEVLNDSLHVSC